MKLYLLLVTAVKEPTWTHFTIIISTKWIGRPKPRLK